MDEIRVEHTSTVRCESYRLARSSTRLRIRKSQASPLTAGNCIRGPNPCPLQSHSRAHPRFGQPTLPDWERLSRNSSNTSSSTTCTTTTTTTIHTGHAPPSISRGPGWSPQPISPSHEYHCVVAPEDEVEISIHQPLRTVHVQIPPACHLGLPVVRGFGQNATIIDTDHVRVSVLAGSSSLDSEPMAIIDDYYTDH
jgi:hypothetical protein